MVAVRAVAVIPGVAIVAVIVVATVSCCFGGSAVVFHDDVLECSPRQYCTKERL